MDEKGFGIQPKPVEIRPAPHMTQTGSYMPQN